MANTPQSALGFVKTHYQDYLDQLAQFIAIPSISIKPDYDPETKRAGAWMAERLKALNPSRLEVIPTPRYPVVYAELPGGGPAAPTVMVYGHYDVMSVDPIEEWETEPFEAVQRGDYFYGRGASDMKGPIMACLAAVEALQSTGEIPVKIKFLIEGEEESSPNHLDKVLAAHPQLFACDVCLNTDAGMAGADTPSIVYGLRGHITGILRLQGASHDVHSGMYGGAIDNPLHVLSRLIAGLHDDQGRVTLPGFYDDVTEVSKEERSKLAQFGPTDEALQKTTGVPALWGEKGYTAYERSRIRPAINVAFIEGGSLKSAVPAKASAGFGIRSVPYQDPEKIFTSLERYFEETLPNTVTWTFERRGKCSAVLVDVDSPWVDAMRAAMERVWGKPPIMDRIGGSIPAVSDLKDGLGIDSVLTGFTLPDDNIHGPNERLHLPTWERGIEALIHFFNGMAEIQNS